MPDEARLDPTKGMCWCHIAVKFSPPFSGAMPWVEFSHQKSIYYII